jgi:aconitate hydratase
MTRAFLKSGNNQFRVTSLGYPVAVAHLPFIHRILLENVMRIGDEASLAAVPDWLAQGRSDAEIAFHPGRIIMHDTTCGPALVDIAAARSALAHAGGDPTRLRPSLRVDVSTDHSVAVDHFGTPDALKRNMETEIRRNAERYRLMKWAGNALGSVFVHPPGTGIMHTINLEQLAQVVTEARRDDQDWAMPDTLIGTDSHTPMINGIGVLGWGVGGLEAESVMFGLPVMMRVPQVVGMRLRGRLAPGVTATDLALTVTHILRRHGIDGRFVEFFGSGVQNLSAGVRATVANMAPEYGAATGFFAIDDRTLDYLRATGRSETHVALVRDYAQAQGLWLDPQASPRYSEMLELDLATVTTSLAGPRRPQDRLSPSQTRSALETMRGSALRNGNPPDGAVAIAAITSCTNTSDPRALMTAGLVARRARALGLSPPAWVKTSLAPGSPAASAYLARAGLLADLESIGFAVVGYGCTTCIGNSGPLAPAMQTAMAAGVFPAAVLSGNRNFPGRVHSVVDAAFLASPALVVAYALAGDAARDIQNDPIGKKDGRDLFLRDLWPSETEIDAAMALAARPQDYGECFAAAETSAAWAALDAPQGALYPWDPDSTYLRPPPFAAFGQMSRLGVYQARPILVVGDDITTDHISPAGAIAPGSEAGAYLTAHGDDPDDLNAFSARRGNWEAMVRGLFTNRAVKNLLGEDIPAGSTIHAPDGAILPLWRAAARYAEEDQPVVIVAGERYGMGSSRDWAAKGAALLGVRAILASSFERIHRSNLINMGILPLILPEGITPQSLGLRAQDRLSVSASPERLAPRADIAITVAYADWRAAHFIARADVETSMEVRILRAGGMLPFILRRALAEDRRIA